MAGLRAPGANPKATEIAYASDDPQPASMLANSSDATAIGISTKDSTIWAPLPRSTLYVPMLAPPQRITRARPANADYGLSRQAISVTRPVRP